MPASDFEPATRSQAGRLILAGGLVLAVGAAAVLVLSDDQRWLRFGVIAALWAALIGAFLAARYRGRAGERDDRAADLQAMYELELEREIAARREYEARLEVEIRTQVEDQARQDVAALRDELRTLRQTLENLLGGEVLVERYALQARATRMRALPEEMQQRPLKRLAAGGGAGPRPGDPMTEVFDSVRSTSRPVQPVPRQDPPPLRVVDPAPAARPPQPQRPTGPDRIDPGWTPSWEQRDPRSRPPQTSGGYPRAQASGSFPPAQRSSGGFPPAQASGAFPPAQASGAFPPAQASGAFPPAQRSGAFPPAQSSGAAFPPAQRHPQQPPGYPNPQSSSGGFAPAAPTGRRHRPDNPEPEPQRRRHARPEDPEPGGRRRRAEGVPAWQEVAAWKPEAAPGNRTRNERTGSHTSGSHSVADLLASQSEPPRRRRRRED
ncbi:MAG TPA: DUF6779 domain-containing protein [Actinophytocola sp.]|uniref:DUF6779 domain-containing protein n=1 Tax=Actinophytocola sp. TaxID=1872138 RepID=UPI002DBEF652|nr:DUF6779 domain-containing protein [Actinophytocola sp.]HEU5471838.1 DUF6779 domain-containing protein [Actinophytocola sp.]